MKLLRNIVNKMLISNRFKIDLYLNNVFYAVLLLILVVLPFMGNSQQKFSLEEAVQKAQKSNGKLNLQKLDAIDAEHQLKEYYAIGMPKLTGGVGYNYFLDIFFFFILTSFSSAIICIFL